MIQGRRFGGPGLFDGRLLFVSIGVGIAIGIGSRMKKTMLNFDTDSDADPDRKMSSYPKDRLS